ncbi:MAG: exosortase system-associated protein, TIGR04073 family [Candidatus Nitrosoglobus sp.]
MVGYKIPSAIRLIALLPFLLFSFASPALAKASYGANIGEKLGSGLVNVATGWIEIPKNIINTSRDSNVGIGVTWGLIKGIGNTIGRTLVGAGELATFFIPTPELVHPTYVFEDFHRDTTYGTAP